MTDRKRRVVMGEIYSRREVAHSRRGEGQESRTVTVMAAKDANVMAAAIVTMSYG